MNGHDTGGEAGTAPGLGVLVSNDILTIDRQVWPSMPKIKELHLLCYKLNDEFIACITDLVPNIEVLFINNDRNWSQFILNNVTKSLAKLKELTLGHFEAKPDSFCNIPKLAPNLKKFTSEAFLNSELNHDIDDQVLKCLSHLKSLEYLHFKRDEFTNCSATDSGVSHLFDNCPQLKTIDLDFIPKITTKTIDKMIKMANKRPNEKFYFGCWEDHRHLKRDDIPSNLQLDITFRRQSPQYYHDESDDSDYGYGYNGHYY